MPLLSTPSGTVLTFTRGGVVGNLPCLPGQGHLPKRMRAKADPSQLSVVFQALGRASTHQQGKAAEANYYNAYKASGVKLRRRYRP